MHISIRKDTKKGAEKYNNHKVYADDQLVGYVGHPSIYDHSTFVFISKDPRFDKYDDITADNVQQFKTILAQ